VQSQQRLLPDLSLRLLCRDWTARAFASCEGDEEEDKMEKGLKTLISKIYQMGELQSHDWENEPFPKYLQLELLVSCFCPLLISFDLLSRVGKQKNKRKG